MQGRRDHRFGPGGLAQADFASQTRTSTREGLRLEANQVVSRYTDIGRIATRGLCRRMGRNARGCTNTKTPKTCDHLGFQIGFVAAPGTGLSKQPPGHLGSRAKSPVVAYRWGVDPSRIYHLLFDIDLKKSVIDLTVCPSGNNS